jgi:hypothetical protein
MKRSDATKIILGGIAMAAAFMVFILTMVVICQ